MGVRIFALDSNYIDQKQLAWLEKELAASGSEWKIVFFHHPLYSSGRNHGPALSTREVLEPIFVRHGVSVVLTGHEHFYERIKPQKGILHFISGGGGKLRPGDILKNPQTDKGFDTDLHFLMMEIDGDDLLVPGRVAHGQDGGLGDVPPGGRAGEVVGSRTGLRGGPGRELSKKSTPGQKAKVQGGGGDWAAAEICPQAARDWGGGGDRSSRAAALSARITDPARFARESSEAADADVLNGANGGRASDAKDAPIPAAARPAARA